MKKYIFICIVLSTLSICKAQLYPGVVGGVQFSSLKGSDGKMNWRESNGYRIGGFVEWPWKKAQFGLRLETTLAQMNFKDSQSSDHLKLYYLSIPFSWMYIPNRQVHLHIGPQVNVLMRQKGPSVWDSPEAGKMETIDYGVHGSLEIFFAYKWSVAFRYYQGLKYNTEYSMTTGTATTAIRANRISSIQLCVNYSFIGDKDKRKEKGK